jgi:predicted ATPase/DNA-binding winged helix-turn-helix (wHTH) protein
VRFGTGTAVCSSAEAKARRPASLWNWITSSEEPCELWSNLRNLEFSEKFPKIAGVDHAPDAPGIVEFGRFRVVPHRRELLADGRPIKLGGREFDLLLALLEVPGAVISKDELMNRVWLGRIVEENRLQGTIAALRKAFGADRDLIRTIAGRGYQFTGETRMLAGDIERAAPQLRGSPAKPVRTLTNLREPVSELIGREAELSEVMDLVATQRLVTLLGEGGIGKTRLGLEVARHLLPEFPDGVRVAELGPLSDPDLVPATVAAAFGLEFASGTISADGVANALGSAQVMLVLDNCEHVIAAAANMAEALLHANSAARVLATSREPLRAEGECLYRVPPLAVPAEGSEDIGHLLRHGAVRLFVARARAADPHFSPDPGIASAVAGICRRLDGIPLAIELAAARGGVLGIPEIAARLDDRFHLLTGGHRTALPRQQTLRATLDWSYDLLPEPERVVLRRVAIFAAGFSLTTATAIAAMGEISATDVVEGIANLVAKSLVRTDTSGASPQYRLLETTRAYALEKLTECGEFETIARRHAEHYLKVFEQAEAEWEIRPTAEWVPDYGRHIDNLRAALDWAMSSNGNVSIGVALTVASVPLWAQLLRLDECRRYVERALSILEVDSGYDARHKMKLNAALGLSLMQTEGPTPAGAAWRKALALAESLADVEYQLRALWALWAGRLGMGDYRTTLPLAQRFCSLAANQADPADQLIGDRMMGVLLHYRGDQAGARDLVERVLARYVAPAHRSHTVRFQYDNRVLALVTLARVLWLEGFPDQAMRTAQSSVDQARAVGHAMSVCNALAHAACPIALFVGDLPAAQQAIAILLEESAKNGLTLWQVRGRCLNGAVQIKQGDAVEGLRLIRAALVELRQTEFLLGFTEFTVALVEGFMATGQIRQGLLAIDEALEQSERNEEHWSLAELLRTKGELTLRQGGQNAAGTAEDLFLKALDSARRQGARSWELRAMTSLARLRGDEERAEEAQALLVSVYSQFTEGFETADLRAAKALVDDLRRL